VAWDERASGFLRFWQPLADLDFKAFDRESYSANGRRSKAAYVELCPGRTSFVIAHCLSMIRHAIAF
jgi:hypothetical protein